MRMKKIISSILLGLIVQTSLSCSKDDYDFEPVDNIEHAVDENIPIKNNRPNTQTPSFVSFDVSLYANNIKSHQSAAVYGDYAVFVTDRRSIFYLYNLKTKQLLCEKQFEAVNEKIGKYILYHCNETTFGVDFYKENDPFPLLYITQRARADKRCIVEVFRLRPERTTPDSDFTSLDAELVQTIYFPVMTAENFLGRVNCVIDAKNKLMYSYSYNLTSGDANYMLGRVTSFQIPDIKEAEVYLNDDSIVDSFDLSYTAVNSQGGCINNGILYIGQGMKSAGYIYLNIIDLNDKKVITRTDLLANGSEWEPEGCFYYNGAVMLSAGKNIWELKFH